MAKATFNNVHVSVKGSKLHLTIDMEKYTKRELTPDMSTGENGEGASYRVAGTSGGGTNYVTIEGMEGVKVKLDVIVNKKAYAAILEKERQKAMARQALEEIELLKKAASASGADEKLNILNNVPSDLLAQALAIVQTLQAQKANA